MSSLSLCIWIAEQEPGWCMLQCMPTLRLGMPHACCSIIIIGQGWHIWNGHTWCDLGNNAHAQDVQNGIVVEDVRDDLCHSSRTRYFVEIPMSLNPTRSTLVVLEWFYEGHKCLRIRLFSLFTFSCLHYVTKCSQPASAAAAHTHSLTRWLPGQLTRALQRPNK